MVGHSELSTRCKPIRMGLLHSILRSHELGSQNVVGVDAKSPNEEINWRRGHITLRRLKKFINEGSYPTGSRDEEVCVDRLLASAVRRVRRRILVNLYPGLFNSPSQLGTERELRLARAHRPNINLELSGGTGGTPPKVHDFYGCVIRARVENSRP